MVRFLAGFAVLCGCYSPQPVPGAPCTENGACPDGLSCVADRCVPPGSTVDAGDDATDAPIDTMTDAMPDAMIDASQPLPVLVQQATNFASPGITVTASFSALPTAGNIIVAVGGCPSSSLDTINGGASTWVNAARSTAYPNVEVFVGVSNGEKSVTIGLPTCTGQISLSISEWDRLSVNPIDQVDANAGLASPATAGSIMPSAGPRLLLFSVASYTPNTFGTPSDGPWSELTPIVDGVETRTWYRVVTAPGTFAPSVSETRHEWDATLVSLKPE